ncbi:MAG: hypothetical protein GY842_06450 [bacterium]|nr:hypothetical protein [bacterium]
MVTAIVVLLAGASLLGEPIAAESVAPEVDAILTRLEKTGDGIQGLRCALEYRVDDRINLDELAKFGAITFRRAQPHDTFMIHFHKLVQDDIATKKKEWYLFRDRWLWEVKERTATIIKREIVAPGERIDLFDLETAPFPVPFGQKKASILKSFVVTLAAPVKGDPPDTDHLVCVPRADTQLARDYKKLEFFVSRSLHLPVRIVATELDGYKVTTASFGKIEIDPGLTDRDFAGPPSWKNYTVSTEPRATPPSTIPGS